MTDGSAVASWVEFADERAQFNARRVEPDGTRSAATTISGIAAIAPAAIRASRDTAAS
jgi:hypothetical protein